jgi:hypothetical protein
MDLLGEEEFKPITKYGVEIPNYFVSKDGRILSTKTKKHKMFNPQWEKIIEGYKVPLGVRLSVNIEDIQELIEDFEYALNHNVTPTVQINIKVHRAVMEAWKPIDKYPPIPMEDWDRCPESVKEFIRETAIIDHKDDDTANNHVDNLEWSTPIKNSKHRKKQRTGV